MTEDGRDIKKTPTKCAVKLALSKTKQTPAVFGMDTKAMYKNIS